MHANAKDLTKEPQFGKWTVLRATEQRFGRHIGWECRCECGTVRVISGHNLKGGQSTNCGCVRIAKINLYSKTVGRQRLKHGQARKRAWTREYSIWKAMRRRCKPVERGGDERYGGRGITVCDRWHTFENFIADMGACPSDKHEIDRKENDGNYEPGNCHWATRKEQASNTRRNRYVMLNGERVTISEAARRIGIHRSQLGRRIALYGERIALALPNSQGGVRLSELMKD